MLDQGLRLAILSLQAKGHGIRQIARALQISPWDGPEGPHVGHPDGAAA